MKPMVVVDAEKTMAVTINVIFLSLSILITFAFIQYEEILALHTIFTQINQKAKNKITNAILNWIKWQ